MKRSILLSIVATITLAGCAGVRHNPGAAEVRVVKNIAAVSDCAEVGMAKARGKWLGKEQRDIQIRNSAHMMGADTVLVIDKTANIAPEGRAYRCKQ